LSSLSPITAYLAAEGMKETQARQHADQINVERYEPA